MKTVSWKRTAISLGLGLVVLAIAFTFFNKKAVDDGALEQQLAGEIATQQEIPEDQVLVDCPSSEEQKKGTEFDCTVTIGQTKTTRHVKLTDDDGHFTARPPKNPAPETQRRQDAGK